MCRPLRGWQDIFDGSRTHASRRGLLTAGPLALKVAGRAWADGWLLPLCKCTLTPTLSQREMEIFIGDRFPWVETHGYIHSSLRGGEWLKPGPNGVRLLKQAADWGAIPGAGLLPANGGIVIPRPLRDLDAAGRRDRRRSRPVPEARCRRQGCGRGAGRRLRHRGRRGRGIFRALRARPHLWR